VGVAAVGSSQFNVSIPATVGMAWVDLLGGEVTSLEEEPILGSLLVYGRVVINVRFTSNTVRLKVLENVLRDQFGNYNFESETVEILLGSEQRTLHNYFTIVGNNVPFNTSVCITPLDIKSVRGYCGKIVFTEGGGSDQCTFDAVALNYTEVNRGGNAIGPSVYNRWTYDGTLIKYDIFTTPLLPNGGGRNTLNQMRLGDAIVDPTWGVIDGNPHTIKLMLDAGSYRINGGQIGVLYCGFDGPNTRPKFQPCGCHPDIKSSGGIQAGAHFWNWNSKLNCLDPRSAVVEGGVLGIYMTFPETEAVHMHGANALALGYISMSRYRSTVSIGLADDPSTVVSPCVQTV
jgi:hypothetical protein